MTSTQIFTAAEETIVVSPITMADVDEMYERMKAAGFDNVNEDDGYMISLEEGEEGVDTGAVEIVDIPLPF